LLDSCLVKWLLLVQFTVESMHLLFTMTVVVVGVGVVVVVVVVVFPISQ
jgi:hypothetical protein